MLDYLSLNSTTECLCMISIFDVMHIYTPMYHNIQYADLYAFLFCGFLTLFIFNTHAIVCLYHWYLDSEIRTHSYILAIPLGFNGAS